MLIPLGKRQFAYGCGYDGRQVCSSAWFDWVRWVVLACVVVFFIGIFFFCSCLSARRRRHAGQQPYYGTGWAARHGEPTYNPHGYGPASAQQQNQWQQPAPPYQQQGAAQPPPPDYNQHAGFFGRGAAGNDNGYELQAPGGSYQPAGRERSEYEPPAGPPPSKKGGAHGV